MYLKDIYSQSHKETQSDLKWLQNNNTVYFPYTEIVQLKIYFSLNMQQ